MSQWNFQNPRGRSRRNGEVPWDRILITIPVLLLVILVVVLAAGSFYTVEPHEQAVVMRFGKYSNTVSSGLWFKIPLVDQVLKVNVQENSVRLPYGAGAGRPQQAPEEDTLMLTGDLNAASVEWTVQWKVIDPYQYAVRFYRSDDTAYAERVITTVAQTVMNRLVGDYSIDEVLTEKRGQIAEEARQATQEILDVYSCGIAIRDLQMQRVTPPDRVRPSFDQVNASIQMRDKLENEANKIRNELLPRAYAEQDKLIREAEGYADRRRAEAEGEIKALLAKYHAYEQAPDVTRQRLYLEAMEEVLSGVESKVIVDASLQEKVLPLLPLDDQGTRR
jgi:membrane protease subunit HflK